MNNQSKKRGIVFWVTGLPGSGKTSIAKKLKNPLKKIWQNNYYKWR